MSGSNSPANVKLEERQVLTQNPSKERTSCYRNPNSPGFDFFHYENKSTFNIFPRKQFQLNSEDFSLVAYFN